MVKFGIVTAEQFRPSPKGLVDRIRAMLASGRISFQLLRDPIVTADDSQLFDQLMHSIRLSNGINRTTFRKRFVHLDQAVNALLLSRFRYDTRLDIHDWAASDCITSAEWAGTLLEAFPNATLTASDLALYLLEVLCPGGGVFMVQRDLEPLQYIKDPFVVRLNPPEPKVLAVNYLLARRAIRKFSGIRECLRPALDHLDRGKTSVELPPYRVDKVSLVHPQAVSLQARNSRFRVQRHSIFERLTEPVDVIRSMNIFNPAHFSEEELAQGVRAVADSLKPGGIWIVGRTGSQGEERAAVSILENTPSGFRRLQLFGDASDVEEIAVRSCIPR